MVFDGVFGVLVCVHVCVVCIEVYVHVFPFALSANAPRHYKLP